MERPLTGRSEISTKECRVMVVNAQMIAELAGVYRGTVDRALHNRGRIRTRGCSMHPAVRCCCASAVGWTTTCCLKALRNWSQGHTGSGLPPTSPKTALMHQWLCEQGIPVITLNLDVPGSHRLCFVGQDNSYALPGCRSSPALTGTTAPMKCFSIQSRMSCDKAMALAMAFIFVHCPAVYFQITHSYYFSHLSFVP